MTWLLRTDRAFSDIGCISVFLMEMAFGDDENDFRLEVPYDMELEKNTLVYVPETEWGGLIREPTIVRENGQLLRAYEGPTWHGLLAQRVLRPDAGKDYLTVSGMLDDVIGGLIARCGLDSIFEVGECPETPISFTFDRYCTLYEGLRKMLLSIGYILSIKRPAWGKTRLGALPRPKYIDDDAGSRFGFRVKRCHPVNHLVCLGKGELAARAVVDVYADSNGKVSRTKSISGIDEIEETYDDSTAEMDDLVKDGVKRLTELQELSQVELELPTGGDYCIDSIVGVSEAKTGLDVTASVCKVVAEFGDSDVPNVTYKLSDAVITEVGRT